MGQKTKTAVILGAFFTAGAVAFSFYFFSETPPWDIPHIHSRRSAKEYCSCRFVLQNSVEDCEKKIFDIIPFGYMAEQGDQVEMSFLWSKHRAYLESKKLGCRVK